MTYENGACSSTCEGSKADTIGVYEFDTVSEAFVGSHNIKEGTGFGANPLASSDGNYVFLFGEDGGQNVRVLRTGSNGQKAVRAVSHNLLHMHGVKAKDSQPLSLSTGLTRRRTSGLSRSWTYFQRHYGLCLY